jgi:NADPH-dependent 2,4-dienoyl-CoA reductase/sulfur reductase-like enzyme
MCDRLYTGRTYQWRSDGQYDPECTSIEMKKIRILILGGGFGGIYAALEFERRCDPQFDVTLISPQNASGRERLP